MEDGMDEELRFHVEQYEADLVRSGVAPAEAKRLSRMRFGSLEVAKEQCREARWLRWPDELQRNVRFAVRVLRKSPGFTAVTMITLALCIGANTAVYSVVDAVLFRPIPYAEPERLAQVVTRVHAPGMDGINDDQDGAAWEALKHARSLEVAAELGLSVGVNLVAGRIPLCVQQTRITSGYFRVLGVPLQLGREFSEEEDRPGGPAAAILSHDLWMRVFAGDPAIVGKAILLKGEPHVVIGVARATFRPMTPADLWTPLRPSTTGEGGGENYIMTARVRAAFDWPQARSEAGSRGSASFHSGQFGPNAVARMDLLPLQEVRAGFLRTPMLVLWAAVGIVLLIGCVNIASLMLARGASRAREIGTRVALGGGRGAVVRQLLTESAVLSLAGGLAGIALGYAAIRGMTAVAEGYGIWQGLRLDLRVLAVMLAASLATSVVFGLVPAWRVSRVDVRAALLEGGSRAVAGRRSSWLGRTLVASEVALGLMLLIGAGLLVRTLLYLRSMPPGFDGRGVIAASVSLQDARYRDAGRVNRLYTQTLERIRSTPGVESASVGLHLPYERWLNIGVQFKDGPAAKTGWVNTTLNYVHPGYFKTLRIGLRAGRFLDERDTATSQPVCVVNEAFVRKYLRDQPAIGSHILMGNAAAEIVGVVGDVQQRPGLEGFGPIGAVYAAYVPATQFSGFELVHRWFSPSWIVRGSLPRRELVKAVQNAIRSVDHLLPLSRVRAIDEERDKALRMQRLSAALLATLAGLAMLLAAVGVYGVVSNSVVQRTRELGIRMAFGASVRQALLSAARPGVVMAGAGVLVGLGLAAALSPVLGTLLYGVKPGDPWTFAAAGLGLLFIAVLASVIPAMRVLRLDPARALRDE
jgi:predicted permease